MGCPAIQGRLVLCPHYMVFSDIRATFFNTGAVALLEGEAKRENHKASITRRDIKRGNDNSIKHKKRIQLDTVHERRMPFTDHMSIPSCSESVLRQGLVTILLDPILC